MPLAMALGDDLNRYITVAIRRATAINQQTVEFKTDAELKDAFIRSRT